MLKTLVHKWVWGGGISLPGLGKKGETDVELEKSKGFTDWDLERGVRRCVFGIFFYL